MDLYTKLEIQKPIKTRKIISSNTEVNTNSFIDEYIIAKVSARDRFILYPAEYENLIQSALEDIRNNIDTLLDDF